MENNSSVDSHEIMCRDHYIMIFFDNGTSAVFERIRNLDKITDSFKKLVEDTCRNKVPVEWQLIYEISYFDGTLDRHVLCAGTFVNFLDRFHYDLSVYL